MENWEPWFWSAWLIMFLVVEIPAILNARKGDTFTESWRRWWRIRGGVDATGIPVKPWPIWVAVPVHLGMLAFGIWLTGHLGFGLWG